MEEKINIAEILKDKPQGTKLYNRLYNIDVELDTIGTTGTGTIVWSTDKTDNNDICYRFYSEFGTIRGYPDGLQILSPSKEMRDWCKFAWKKGDVLVSNDGNKKVFFNGFTDDTYTLFKAKHGLEVLSNGNTIYLGDEDGIATSDYTLEDNDAAQTYIKTIEERLGGKLNLETLEVEKPQAEFKDGDILSCDEDSYTRHTTLIFHKNGDTRESIVSLIRHKKLIETNEPINDFLLSRLNYASEDEKKELFNALAKEGKAWDAEKKQVMELNSKCKFKPFDKVLVRDSYDDMWRACFFSHIREDGRYVTTCFTRKFCIPYEGNERLLGTTNNFE